MHQCTGQAPPGVIGQGNAELHGRGEAVLDHEIYGPVSVPEIFSPRVTECVLSVFPFGLFETFGMSRKTVEPSLSIRIYDKGKENSLVMARKVSWRMRSGG